MTYVSAALVGVLVI